MLHDFHPLQPNSHTNNSSHLSFLRHAVPYQYPQASQPSSHPHPSLLTPHSHQLPSAPSLPQPLPHPPPPPSVSQHLTHPSLPPPTHPLAQTHHHHLAPPNPPPPSASTHHLPLHSFNTPHPHFPPPTHQTLEPHHHPAVAHGLPLSHALPPHDQSPKHASQPPHSLPSHPPLPSHSTLQPLSLGQPRLASHPSLSGPSSQLQQAFPSHHHPTSASQSTSAAQQHQHQQQQQQPQQQQPPISRPPSHLLTQTAPAPVGLTPSSQLLSQSLPLQHGGASHALAAHPQVPHLSHLQASSLHQAGSHPQSHHHSSGGLLPSLTQSHLRQSDDVEVSDDLMPFGTLQTNRSSDMNAALSSSAFQPEHLAHHQDAAVMDALLPEPEQDPLHMNVALQVPLQIDQPRSIERQVLSTSEAEPVRQPTHSTHALIGSASAATPPVVASQAFALNGTTGTHLSYGSSNTSTGHAQASAVALQGPSSVSTFQVPVPLKSNSDGPPMLMLGRNAGRQTTHAGNTTAIANNAQAEDGQRRASIASNQMSIQDLTKPKMERVETSQDAHFSPSSPAYSAVTISPPTLLQPSQGLPTGGAGSGGSASGSGSAGGSGGGGASGSGGIGGGGTVVATVTQSNVGSSQSPTSVATPSGLSCPICKTQFTRRYNLKVHMTSKHSARRDYHCKQCPNAFNRGDSLKRHIATTHRGEKKWTCSYCHRNFGQRPHMKMHIDTVHLKKRDHKCHCGKAFGTRYNLTAHQRTHQQTPKKHMCLVCKKSFALKSSLARHQRNSAHSNADLTEPKEQN